MKELLMQAREEIVTLRRRNEILEAQVGVVEIFAAALGFKRNERGKAVDIAWLLQRRIDEMNTPKVAP